MPPGGPTGGPLRILVVEDSEDSREMLVALLRMWGHTTDEAGDGEAALARYGAQRPDIALIDVGLPGLDGYEVARRIRSIADPAEPPVRLVAVTGYGQPADLDRARAAGFDVHLLKPVDPEELRALLSAPRPAR